MLTKKIFIFITGLLVLVIVLGFSLTRSKLIEVDGYNVETVIKGDGELTIIFESGFTGGRIPWLLTQYQLSRNATTLVYERAGLGKSDLRPEARTASQMANELYALLQETELLPPYVLVGHSAGGLYMKLFASRYPEQIAGLVFVDPATAEVYEHWQSNEPNGWAGIEDKLRELGATEGTLGQLRALPQSIEEVRNIGLPAVPTTIITATNPSSMPLETVEDMAFWLESHKRLASSIPDSRHVIYNDKNHINILFDSRIVDEILAVVDQVN